MAARNSTLWTYTDYYKIREQDLREKAFDAYCLFCATDHEIKLTRELNYLNAECLALPFLRMKREGSRSNSFLVQKILLSGYVFIFCPTGYGLNLLRRGETPFRILDRKENGGLLVEDDRKYADWVLKQGGILDLSKAIQVGDRVKIISGPLLDLQGYITGYSKKSRNFRVQFEMMGVAVNTWLPFELVEPTEKWRELD